MAYRTILAPYARLVSAQIRSQAQYRTSFVIDLVSQTIFTVLEFTTVFVMFQVTPTLGGFDFVEVLLISSLSISGFTLADLLVGNVERLSMYVRTGLLDSVLIRPRRVLPQLLAVDFQLRRVGRVGFSVAVLVLAAAAAKLDWTWWRVVLVVVTPLTAAAFFSAVFVMTATTTFWWIEAREFANSFTYGGRDFTTYPLTIYGTGFRRIFGHALGFGFVAYYPALVLLGRQDPLGAPTWLGWAGAPIAFLAVGLAAFLWRLGVRHYKGTGS